MVTLVSVHPWVHMIILCLVKFPYSELEISNLSGQKNHKHNLIQA